MSSKGHQENIDRLFRQFYKPLRAYAYRIVNDVDDAEDVVQDVFMGVWTNRETLRAEDNIRTYLFRAVYNRSLNLMTLKRYTEEDSLDQLVDEINLNYAVTVNPEHFMAAAQIHDEIELFVATLSPGVRDIFLASRKEGLKIREIAERMNISSKTVEKHLYATLAGLREHLVRAGYMGSMLLSILINLRSLL